MSNSKFIPPPSYKSSSLRKHDYTEFPTDCGLYGGIIREYGKETNTKIHLIIHDEKWLRKHELKGNDNYTKELYINKCIYDCFRKIVSPELLRVLIGEIFTNAIKYGNPGNIINIDTEMDDEINRVRLTITSISSPKDAQVVKDRIDARNRGEENIRNIGEGRSESQEGIPWMFKFSAGVSVDVSDVSRRGNKLTHGVSLSIQVILKSIEDTENE